MTFTRKNEEELYTEAVIAGIKISEPLKFKDYIERKNSHIFTGYYFAALNFFVLVITFLTIMGLN